MGMDALIVSTAMILWYVLSINPQTARSFPNVVCTISSYYQGVVNIDEKFAILKLENSDFNTVYSFKGINTAIKDKLFFADKGQRAVPCYTILKP